MNRYLYAALICTCAWVGGCASQGALDNVRNDVDTVKTRLYSAEKELEGVREESKSGIGTMEKSFKSDVAAVRKIAADIQATIDSTKSEAQAINGRLDDLNLALKKPTEELSRYRDDTDKRLLTLEDRIQKVQNGLNDLTKKLDAVLKQKAAAPTPDDLYLKGLEAFKAGDMTGARSFFQKFLEQNPQHELAANAQYWIGETYYSDKDYEPAIIAFQEVIKKYPGKDKVAAAMLKQAMAFKGIDDVKSARYVLKKLIETAPKSDEAKKAKELLKELR